MSVTANQKILGLLRNREFSKIAGMVGEYIRQSVYENSFVEKVLHQRPVDPSELIPEIDSDTTYVIGQLEQPTDRAITMNFQGRPYTTQKSGLRYKIPLGYNSTKITSKPEQEMLAYNYDFFKDLGEKEVYELHFLRDAKTIAMLNAAVALSGKSKDFAAPDANTIIHPEKSHLVLAANLLESGDRQGMPSDKTLKCERFLMSQTAFNDLALWDSVDVDTLAADLAIRGFASTTLLDKELLVSAKNSLFVEEYGGDLYDVIYALPNPSFLGEVLEVTGMGIQPELWRENGTTTIRRRSAEFFGAGIGNYNGVSRIRLMRKKNS